MGSFFKRYISKKLRYVYAKKVFLLYIDIESLLNKICNEKNVVIEDFREFIIEIGRNYIFENDKEVVENMITSIEEHIKISKKLKVRNLQLNWLIDNLKSYAGIENVDVLD